MASDRPVRRLPVRVLYDRASGNQFNQGKSGPLFESAFWVVKADIRFCAR
jgi:hypothetical protein